MSFDYQSLLGLSTFTADQVNLENLVCKSFQLMNNGATNGYILSCDANGVATWVLNSTTLAGDVTGLASANTVAFIGGSSALLVHSAELLANAATTLNTINTIVKRDGSGNFSAGTITANLTGNCSGSSSTFTSSLVGDVTGTIGATTVSFINGIAANQTVTLTGAQTLTNKTLTLPIISSISNGGTVTLPSGTRTLVAQDTYDLLKNKTIIGITNTVDANSLRNGTTYVVSLSGSAPTTNQVLTYDGIHGVWADVPSLTSVTMAGDVTSASNTSVVSFVGGSTAALVHTAELLANAATSSNVGNTIVKRSGGGDIAIGSLGLYSKITNSAGTTIFDTVSGSGTGRNTYVGGAGTTASVNDNTCVGKDALSGNISGNWNSAFSTGAGATQTSGYDCLYIGCNSDTNSATSIGRIAIGNNAIATSDFMMKLGHSSLQLVKTDAEFESKTVTTTYSIQSGLNIIATNNITATIDLVSGNDILCGNDIIASGNVTCSSVTLSGNIALSGTWGGCFTALTQIFFYARKISNNCVVVSCRFNTGTCSSTNTAIYSQALDSSLYPPALVSTSIRCTVNGVVVSAFCRISISGVIEIALWPYANFTSGTTVAWDEFSFCYVIS